MRATAYLLSGAFALAALSCASAQEAPGQPTQDSYKALEQILQEFAPQEPVARTRGMTAEPEAGARGLEVVPDAPTAADGTGTSDRKLQYITPKKKTAPQVRPQSSISGENQTAAATGAGTSAGQADAANDEGFWAWMLGAIGLSASVEDADPKAGAESEVRADSSAGGTRGVASEQPAAAAAEKGVPIAEDNSIVIQFKPGTSADQIRTILNKYDLVPKQHNQPEKFDQLRKLGILVVKQRPKPATRGMVPAEDEVLETDDTKEQIRKILAPKVVQDLRKEDAVGASFVDTTMTSKNVPKSVKSTGSDASGKTYRWRWFHDDNMPDGNWGLKMMRMPAVWTILSRYRAAYPDRARPKIAVIDNGFAKHRALKFSQFPDGANRGARATCTRGHGTHVAGIIGGRQTADGGGIDGIIPDAEVDAVPVRWDLFGETIVSGTGEDWKQRTAGFTDVLFITSAYLFEHFKSGSNNRGVINMSLAYNWISALDVDPGEIPEIEATIKSQAIMFGQLAETFADRVLLVVAAGNDSRGREEPLHAKWASPLTAATMPAFTKVRAAPNIIIVEAADRQLKRAEFSNVGGHVAAPGVEIMSALPGEGRYGVCNGTSQAAPHVAALAAILMELEPDAKPVDVISAIQAASRAPGEGSPMAPVVDALEAVGKLCPQYLGILADLSGDGKVDSTDVSMFAESHKQIEDAEFNGTAFSRDLNGDGVVDDNECFWPRIDLNGNGVVSLEDTGVAATTTAKRDLDIMAMTWTDTAVDFNAAVQTAGLGRDTMLTASSEEVTPAKVKTSCRAAATP